MSHRLSIIRFSNLIALNKSLTNLVATLTYGMTQSLPTVSSSHKSVTQPSSTGAITTNVSKPVMMVSIRSTEADLLDNLIHQHTSFFINDS